MVGPRLLRVGLAKLRRVALGVRLAVTGVLGAGAFGANPDKQPVNSAPPAPPSWSNIGRVATTPLEWMLNARMFFTPTRQVYAGLGAGTRLTGGFAPDFRALAIVGGSFGITDSTPGLAACFDRDLDAFGEWLRVRGSDDEEIARQLDVRRRGLVAASPEAAIEAGRAWAREYQ